jgi:ABC-type transporter Mla MlaB component
MHSFVRIDEADLEIIIATVFSIWPDRPVQPPRAWTRPRWTTPSSGCIARNRAGTGVGGDEKEASTAATGTTGFASVRASVGSCLLRLERTASGSLTVAVDGEFDQQAATALMRTLDVMDARGAPLFLDLGWVSRIDVAAFCSLVSLRASHGAPVLVIAASAAVERMADLFQAARSTTNRRRSPDVA